jgi:CubicO group peptidase (beta-lactamase class C family)
MHMRAVFLAFWIVALSGPVFADPFPINPPEKVGLSSIRLQRLTAVLQSEVDRSRIPGAVIAISRKGQLAYYQAVGFRDPETRITMPGDAIFSVASMTKPMVSVGVMILHDEGKLFLSDPVGKYLPALVNMQVSTTKTGSASESRLETSPAKRQPTIQDLLRHTSGFTYASSGTTKAHSMWPISSSHASLTYSGSEFIAALGKAPLINEPGTVWDYGVSVDVLGLVIEAISGEPLGAFMEKRLWQPLGMVDTSFSIPDAKKGRYALAFRNDPFTNNPQTALHLASEPMKFECGGGCAVSTAMDYLRFAQMLLNKGAFQGRRILSRKTVELMTSDQLGQDVRERTTSPTLAEGYSFGLGFSVRSQVGRAALAGSSGDFGWGGAFGTSFWVDPEEDLVVVFMAAAPGYVGQVLKGLIKNLVLASIID